MATPPLGSGVLHSVRPARAKPVPAVELSRASPYHVGHASPHLLVSGALLACGMGAARDTSAFEGTGTWLASVGPADNRAHIGLELTRDAGGALRARYTIDLLNFYGASLPPLEPGADGRWGIPAYDFWVGTPATPCRSPA